jgi:chaperonin GroES
MQLNPLHDRVVVKRLDADTKTSSGLIIPDNVAEKPDQGIVIAVGPGKRNSEGNFIPMSVSVGDKALFGKFAGQTVKIKGEEVLILTEEEIYAVIDDRDDRINAAINQATNS